jgi:hypothetical protein
MQYCFRLVVGGMSCREISRAIPTHYVSQECITASPRSSFVRWHIAIRQVAVGRLRIIATDCFRILQVRGIRFAWNGQLPAECQHKSLIFIGLRPAQAMIEMCRNEPTRTRLR